MILTKEQKEKYLKSPNVCPACGHDQIEGGPVEVDNGHCWQNITCNKCGACWTDIYKLIEVEGDEE